MSEKDEPRITLSVEEVEWIGRSGRLLPELQTKSEEARAICHKLVAIAESALRKVDRKLDEN